MKPVSLNLFLTILAALALSAQTPGKTSQTGLVPTKTVLFVCEHGAAKSVLATAEFNRLAAAGYNRVPLVLETYADLDTPLSIYLKLANQPQTYLLESVVGGERHGRYSFIGLAARTRIEVRGYDCIEIVDGREIARERAEDPLTFVEKYLQRFKVATDPRLPRFCGGLVGYFGYDTVRYIEKRLGSGANKRDELGTPDIMPNRASPAPMPLRTSGSRNCWKSCGRRSNFPEVRRRNRSLRYPDLARRPITRRLIAPSTIFSKATSCRWCRRSA